MSSGFRVPVALDERERATTPDDAIKGRQYVCPECRSAVMLVQPTKFIANHFRHYPDGSCSLQSVEHIGAKFLVRDVLNRWLVDADKRIPIIERRCDGVSDGNGLWRMCRNLFTERPPQGKIAACEKRLPNGRQPDVVMFDANDEPIFLVEILRSRAVDKEKREELSAWPWVELEAKAILRDPLRWKPRQWNFKPFQCSACVDAQRVEQAERDALIEEDARHAERQSDERARRDEAERVRLETNDRIERAHRERSRADEARRVAEYERRNNEKLARCRLEARAKEIDKALEPITGPLIRLTPAQERWLEQETQKKLADWKSELAEQLKAKEGIVRLAATDDTLAKEIADARLAAQMRLARLDRYSDKWKACWLAIYLDDKIDEARLARTMMGDFAK